MYLRGILCFFFCFLVSSIGEEHDYTILVIPEGRWETFGMITAAELPQQRQHWLAKLKVYYQWLLWSTKLPQRKESGANSPCYWFQFRLSSKANLFYGVTNLNGGRWLELIEREEKGSQWMIGMFAVLTLILITYYIYLLTH